MSGIMIAREPAPGFDMEPWVKLCLMLEGCLHAHEKDMGQWPEWEEEVLWEAKDSLDMDGEVLAAVKLPVKLTTMAKLAEVMKEIHGGELAMVQKGKYLVVVKGEGGS